eukprot:TRINITY_DN11584_c0_g3_i1.p1 TRINITY_DN11584_c0_g3~~TRINITY_DN11584_c0_g3_i1.p1  ORF type:complete len:153 (-),score=2.80 TRINITY_DN11584_c0_g3_i1:90-548(-)
MTNLPTGSMRYQLREARRGGAGAYLILYLHVCASSKQHSGSFKADGMQACDMQRCMTPLVSRCNICPSVQQHRRNGCVSVTTAGMKRSHSILICSVQCCPHLQEHNNNIFRCPLMHATCSGVSSRLLSIPLTALLCCTSNAVRCCSDKGAST